jgi:hypothetical protein
MNPKKNCNKKFGLWKGITSKKFQNTWNVFDVAKIMKEKTTWINIFISKSCEKIMPCDNIVDWNKNIFNM